MSQKVDAITLDNKGADSGRDGNSGTSQLDNRRVRFCALGQGLPSSDNLVLDTVKVPGHEP